MLHTMRTTLNTNKETLKNNKDKKIPEIKSRLIIVNIYFKKQTFKTKDILYKRIILERIATQKEYYNKNM